MLARALGIAMLGLLAVGLSACGGRATAAEGEWEPVLPTLNPVSAGVVGSWRKDGGALTVNAVTGGRLGLPLRPQGEYDLRATFTRRTGQHSIGLVVVQGGRQVVFEVDAWGQHLAG